MKALDKWFDTQVITGIIKINFILLEAKKILLYEEGKKQTRKIISKLQSLRKSNEFIKVKVNGNTERCIKLQIIWFNWF